MRTICTVCHVCNVVNPCNCVYSPRAQFLKIHPLVVVSREMSDSHIKHLFAHRLRVARIETFQVTSHCCHCGLGNT